MKNVVICRDKFEIARASLERPLLVVGRSPNCDIVLRAPDVKPVHFLLEWVSEGDFDGAKSRWMVTDISNNLTGDAENSEAGEGAILEENLDAALSGFVFKYENNMLNESKDLGGAIKRDLSSGALPSLNHLNRRLVEAVWVKSDSGSIEEIVHIPLRKLGPQVNVFASLPEIELQNRSSRGSSTVAVKIKGRPDAKIFHRGELVESQEALLGANGFLQIKWDNESVYLRLVGEVQVAAIPKFDPAAIFVQICFLLFALMGFQFLAPNELVTQKPAVEDPPRIARIEVKIEEPARPRVEAVKPVAAAPERVKPEEKIKVGLPTVAQNKKPAAAAKPRFKSDDGPMRLGLNSPAKPLSVNQMGVLGLLSKHKAAKGEGVRADLIINQGVQSNTLSDSTGSAAIVIRNPPAGVIGTAFGGDPSGARNNSGALAALTTMRGGGTPDSTSLGPLARQGGKSGFSVGTALDGDGTGVSRGREIGLADEGTFDVLGGLDRETVRRIVAGYRGKIRVCYDRALMSNPKLSGRVAFQWTISSTGPVASAAIQKSTTASATLEQCVRGVIQSMVFPKSANERSTTVNYPFEFQSKG